MYDNYNNNSNNNPKPLFSNEFNNLENNNYNINSSVTNNLNNNPKPLFSNEFNNLGNNNYNMNPSVPNNLNPVSQIQVNNPNATFDLPPELEPIKDLNQVNTIQAPTTDVLSPMNVMPENFSTPTDKLDNYDMGINTYDNMNPMNNFASPSINLENQPVIENYNINNFQNSSTYDNYGTYINQYSNITPDYSGIMPTNDNSFSYDYNLNGPQNNIVIPNVSDTEVFQNNNLSSNYDINFNSSNMNENENNNIENSNVDNPVEKEEQTTPDEQYFVNDDIKLATEEQKEDNSSLEEREINNSEETQESNSNDIKLESSDNDYMETDVLDIIDIDEENEEEQTTENEDEPLPTQEEKEKPLISKNVEEIKEFINKLKENGLKIEIEEFDFEHMYQLIVKIEK